MSLARRIDFELARALEWRDGTLQPLTGAERVEAELAGPLDGTTPAGPVVERARRLLRGPGDIALAWLAAALLLLCLLAALGGAQVGRLALPDPAEGPVNVAWFLAQTLGLQTLFLLVSLAAALGDRTPLGRLLSRTLSFGGLALAAAVRLVASRRGRRGGTGGEVLERLRALPGLRPLALAASHGAWTSFNLALLASTSLILSAEHHQFAWQSTLVHDEARAERVLRALTLPSALWPGAPTSEQVSVSRFDPESRAYLTDLGRPAEALRLRQAWSLQLIGTVAGFGLLPRLALLLLSWLSWRLARRRLLPSADDAYVDAVLSRLAPAVTTQTERVDGAPLHDAPGARSPSGAAAARRARGTTPTRHVAAWLSAAEGHDLSARLGGEGWRVLPRLDSREAEREAVAALQHPAELVLFCDWATTPDASLERWLAEAAPVRTLFVLTGGAAFRATRRGSRPEQVRQRRSLWEQAAARCGAPGEDVIDFDLDSATADSRAELRRRLGAAAAAGELGSGSTGGSDGSRSRASFEEALARIEASAPPWLETFSLIAPAELEAEQLRAAARVRAEVESCFENLPPTARVGGAVVRLAKTAVRGTVQAAGVREEAWSQALGEAARLGRLLAKVRDIEPRWAIAGLSLGLVAGPLGGAIAAGSAGLVAGASLMGMLGPLGAALGSALSLDRGRQRGRGRESSATPAKVEQQAGDRLGLPARAGVLRALELHLQGLGEEELSRELGALIVSEEGAATLDTAEDVAALCERALAIGQAARGAGDVGGRPSPAEGR